ncbi:MAG: hypothetical protein Tsb009_12230 [Planctomycetaceae bacterium]
MGLAITGISIICQFAAAILAYRMSIRIRKTVLLPLALALFLMGLHRSYSLFNAIALDQSVDTFAEFIALIISLLLLGGMIGLYNHSKHSGSIFERDEAGRDWWPRAIPRTALILGAGAILGSCFIGYLAYQSSSRIIRENIHRNNLTLAHALSECLHRSHEESPHAPPSQAELLKALEDVWTRTSRYGAADFVCVIGNDGRLLLNSKRPRKVGVDVSGVRLSQDGTGPRTVGDLLELQQSWTGENVNHAGNRQVASYVYNDDLQALIAVHRSSSSVDTEIDNAMLPCLAGMTAVSFLLVPLALGLLHWSHSVTLKERNQAEKSLHESERRIQAREKLYRDAIATIQGAAYQRDLIANKYVYMDSSIEQLLGYSHQEVTPELWPRIVKKSVLRGAGAGLTLAEAKIEFEKGSFDNWQADYQCVARNGKLIWLSDSSIPLRDENDRLIGSLGILQDITERKRQEEELEKSEAKFRNLTEEIPVSISIFQDGKRIFTNQWAKEITGYSSDELIKMSPGELLDPEHRERRRKLVEDCLERGISGRGEFRGRKKSGEVGWVDYSVTRIDFEGRPALLGMSIDITQRKLAEQALEENRRFIEAVTSATPYFIYVIDVESLEVQYFNRSLARELGYGEEHPDPKTVADLLEFMPEEEHQYMQQVVSEWMDLSHGEIREDEYFLKCADGSLRTFLGREVLFTDSPSGARQILGTTFDITDRRTQQRRLRLAEHSIKMAPDAIYWFHPDGSFFHTNDQAARMTQYSAEELCQMKISDINPAVTAESWPQSWENVKKHGSLMFEQTHRRKDGSEFDVEISATHMTFEDEELGVAFVRDISERKRAEQKLSESESNLNSVLSTATDIILSLDLEGRITYINHVTPGYDKDEVIGKNGAEFISGFDQDVFRQAMQSVRETLEPVNYEVQATKLNGNPAWFLTRIGPVIRDQECVGFTVCSTDITARKEMEEALRASEAESVQLREQLVEALESLTEGFALYDADDKLVMCNNRYREVYKESEDLLVIGARFEDHIRESAYRGQVAEAIGREEEWVRERLEQHQNPQGVYLQQLCNGRWIQISERKTKDGGIVGVRTDVTERIEAERELREREAELAHAGRLSLLGETAAGVIHEIMQPIYAIGNYSTACQNYLKNSSEIESHTFEGWLQSISNCTETAKEIIFQIREFSSKDSQNSKPFPLAHSLQNVLSFMEYELKQLQVTVRQDVPKELIITAAEIRIKEVLANVIHNACEAFKEEGTFNPEIEITAKANRNQCVVSISDNGPGLKPELTDKIFDSFVTTKKTGTGLGLSICRRIVESYGGRIWASHNFHRGITITFTLPRVKSGNYEII